MMALINTLLFAVIKDCVVFLDKQTLMVNVPKGGKSEFIIVFIIKERGNQ